ncbi:FolC bifunctional protein [Suhomyces tanzawaensis NRRL Y-17324]|uniref:Folylpolyglutamate synthase n=1 Tax=Suhomyces tanzawaensis NRRL Y-17324 TaxID=984487 RepID=A0A1E4SJW9_9ASCO|nr:FolC bifunctional protein [Suhomyces tanzawaensis NRRL Y-17324]ODV79806.1 FolC bifunctional protein [Suhomyces tanzawaensis NRRL Y-17324]
MKRTYKDAISALNTLQSNFASIEAFKKLGPNVNRNELSILEVYEYTRRLGYSPKDFNRLNIIHITGTKGKGSTCAFTESILKQYQADGLIKKIGLFTSPHLKSVRERIRINGAPITELKFTKYFFEVWDKLSSTTSSPHEFPTLQPCETVKPMYFKYLTILSFHVFMQEGVDSAIYEVGVGGEYDSTNIIDKPTVTGISSLGIDHTFMLGNTIESIAWNKTGIFKSGCPAIVSDQLEFPSSIEVIKSRAQEKNVSSLEIISQQDVLPEGVPLGLAGEFQKQNAALAVKVAEAHLKKLGAPDSDLPKYNDQGIIEELPEKFTEGLANVDWDGRCQIIQNKPGYEKINWYIDGAHTLESINVSSKWFKDEQAKKATACSKNLRILLFNQQSRENADALLTRLYENTSTGDSEFRFDHVIFTTNITWSDGKYNSDLISLNNSQELIDKLVIQKGLAQTWADLDAKNKNNSRKHIFHDIETGVNFIKSLSTSNDHINSEVDVFVCGSLHLVGGFLVVLDNERD